MKDFIVRQLNKSGSHPLCIGNLQLYDFCISKRNDPRQDGWLNNRHMNGWHWGNHSTYTNFILRLIK